MRSKTVGLTAYGLFFTGVSLIMLSVLGAESWHWLAWVAAFVRDVGLLLSAVMAGTIFHEKLLRDEMLRHLVHEMCIRDRAEPDLTIAESCGGSRRGPR